MDRNMHLGKHRRTSARTSNGTRIRIRIRINSESEVPGLEPAHKKPIIHFSDTLFTTQVMTANNKEKFCIHGCGYECGHYCEETGCTGKCGYEQGVI